VTIVRFFNTVGPGQTGRYGMVVPRFVRQALHNEAITVYGDGNQSRCFCHVYDTVRALELLLERTDNTAGEIYNIGSSHEVSINELANEVIARSHSQSSVRLVPYSEAYAPGFEDMRRRVPDTAKIRAAVGWQATRTLNEILDDVIAFERSRLAPLAIA
jgi:UDP-glucose 4-epimerase